ncbi:MAG: hypothetical protein NVS9B13_24540 [Candidatus Acidiferrum sp.]
MSVLDEFLFLGIKAEPGNYLDTCGKAGTRQKLNFGGVGVLYFFVKLIGDADIMFFEADIAPATPCQPDSLWGARNYSNDA